MDKDVWQEIYDELVESTGYEYGDPRLDKLIDAAVYDHYATQADNARVAAKYARVDNE